MPISSSHVFLKFYNIPILLYLLYQWFKIVLITIIPQGIIPIVHIFPTRNLFWHYNTKQIPFFFTYFLFGFRNYKYLFIFKIILQCHHWSITGTDNRCVQNSILTIIDNILQPFIVIPIFATIRIDFCYVIDSVPSFLCYIL